MKGYSAGKEDARKAQAQLEKIGCPKHPVFFAVDFNITLNQWNNTASKYFKGACEVLGKQRVGIYGHSRVIHWAMEDDLVAKVANGRVLGWQTLSWSNGVKASDYAVLYQGTHNVDGPSGIKVDINTTFFDEWGWRPIQVQNTPKQSTPKQSAKSLGINLGNLKPEPKWRGDPVWLPEVLRAFRCESRRSRQLETNWAR